MNTPNLSMNRVARWPGKAEEWPQIRFAVAAPLAKTRLPWATIGHPFRTFSLRLRQQLGIIRALFAVLPLVLAGCSTTHPVAAKDDSETVMVTYHVQSGKEAEFESLLGRAWETYRSGHLVYSEPHVVVRDADGEGKTKYVEIFTWSKSPDHPPAKVLSIWKEEQSLCEARDGHRGIEGGEVNLVTGK